MKRSLFVLLFVLPTFLYAGVILKKSGERLEDISIQSVTDTEIIYKTSNGSEISVSKNDVSAILYDDGRYEEIKSYTPQTTNTIVTGDNSSSTVEPASQESSSPEKMERQTSNVTSDKKRIPKACYDEGQKVYNEVFAETREKALAQGYSKSQAYTIASEKAFEAKQKAIDDCYDNRAIQ